MRTRRFTYSLASMRDTANWHGLTPNPDLRRLDRSVMIIYAVGSFIRRTLRRNDTGANL